MFTKTLTFFVIISIISMYAIMYRHYLLYLNPFEITKDKCYVKIDLVSTNNCNNCCCHNINKYDQLFRYTLKHTKYNIESTEYYYKLCDNYYYLNHSCYFPPHQNLRILIDATKNNNIIDCYINVKINRNGTFGELGIGKSIEFKQKYYIDIISTNKLPLKLIVLHMFISMLMFIIAGVIMFIIMLPLILYDI